MTEARFLLPDPDLPIRVAANRGILQLELLDSWRMAGHLLDHGFPAYSQEDLRLLWVAGLLRADVVLSSRGEGPGLIRVEEDPFGRMVLADTRRATEDWKSWYADDDRLREAPDGIDPYFHPFRLYVVSRLHRVLSYGMHPMQLLISRDGYVRMEQSIMDRLEKRFADDEFCRLVDEWNDLVTFVVASEPCAGEEVFGRFRWPMQVDEKIQRNLIELHFETLDPLYRRLGLERLDATREALCRDAELLDPNPAVYTALRIARKRDLLALGGNLGAAVTHRIMAEVLRRVAERVFETELREEDELGFGMSLAGTKAERYGAKRLFDGDRSVAREYFRTLGFDGGVRVRWYVEGGTEYGALRAYFGFWPAVELVPLHGRVAERGSLAFRQSLRNDTTAGIFSFVSVDGDREEYARAVRQAARDDEICGLIFVSEPDFEFANFSPQELEEILWAWAMERGASAGARESLRGAIESLSSAGNLFQEAGRAVPELLGTSKGEEWGARLMKCAVANRTVRGSREEGKERPIIAALRYAEQTTRVSYSQTRREARVDPETGRLVKRNT